MTPPPRSWEGGLLRSQRLTLVQCSPTRPGWAVSLGDRPYMAPQHGICQRTTLPFYRSGEAPRWTDTLPSPLYGKVRPEHSVSLATFCSPSLYQLLGIKCSYLAWLLLALTFSVCKVKRGGNTGCSNLSWVFPGLLPESFSCSRKAGRRDRL